MRVESFMGAMKSWEVLLLCYSFIFCTSRSTAFVIQPTGSATKKQFVSPCLHFDQASPIPSAYRSCPHTLQHGRFKTRLRTMKTPEIWKRVRSAFRWPHMPHIPHLPHLPKLLQRKSTTGSSVENNTTTDDASTADDKASLIESQESHTSATQADQSDILNKDSSSSKTAEILTLPEQVSTDPALASIEATLDTTANTPQGPRWAVAAAATDLSGTWKPMITPAFKEAYEKYLINCGEGLFFRKAILAAIGLGKEIYEQRDKGRELLITGVSPVAKWGRTLVASGTEAGKLDYEPIFTSFRDPDGDLVQVEAWWENEGTVHKSMLRGKARVLGGEFESRRYLLPDDDSILVCESIFHPPPGDHPKFQKDQVEWRFQRES